MEKYGQPRLNSKLLVLIKKATLREEILARRNFGEWEHSPILVQFGGIYFGDLIKFVNLARINFGERPIFGEHFSGKRMKKEIFRRNRD